MTYDAYAQRKYGAKPIWLYRITFDGSTELYSSSMRTFQTPIGSPDATFLTATNWNVGPILRKSFRRTASVDKVADISIPRSSAIALELRQSKAEGLATVEVWHGYKSDPDNEFVLVFSGMVKAISPSWDSFTLNCFDDSILFDERALGRPMQIPCPFALFSPACGVVKADFTDTETVTVVASEVLTIPGITAIDNFYTNGTLEYGGRIRRIISQIGTTVTLNQPVSDFPSPPFSVDLQRPCSKSSTSCATFSNSVNFGGFKEMHNTPYDGRSIV